MNNFTTNNFLRISLIIGLAIIPFIPIYVANSLFFPFITGKAFVFRIMVEIVFSLWLVLVLREKGTTVVNTDKSVLPKINSLTIVITTFTLFSLLADIFGLNPLRSIWSNFERMEGWIIIIHLWAYFIVLSSVLKSKEIWHNFFKVVLVSGFITALYGMFQFFGWAETHQGSRIDASLGNSAYMAVYMIMNTFIAAYMAVSYFSKKSQFWIYTIASAIFSFVLFQTATRGTILGWTAAVIISCGIYAIFGRKEKGQSDNSRLISGGIIALFILLTVLFYQNRDALWIKSNAVLGRLATISLSDTKTQARGFIWPMAVKGIFENPKTAIIGVGQENFNYIFNSHYDPKMYAHEQWFDRAHSVFLDWLVAGGLIGLSLYLLLYLFAFVYIVKSDTTIGQKSVLIGLIVGYGIHNIFVFDNQTSYIMFFTVLAFIYSLKATNLPSIFKKYSIAPTEDGITLRDYVFLPIIVIAFGTTLYFVNIRPIQANLSLINGLQFCTNAQVISAAPYKNALELNQTIANQEIREQLLSCAANAISNQQVSEQKKIEFYELAKSEIGNQIKETPKDVRMYIIGGSFFDSIRDFSSATSLLEKANELSPNKQTIIYELASNYINIGKTKEGVALMEKAYQLAADNSDAKTNYVVSLIATGQSDVAYKLFPNNPELFNNDKAINAFIIDKQYSKVIGIYKEMLKKEPESQKLYSSLAYAYILSKQNGLAIDTLKTISTKFPLIKAQVDEIIKQLENGTFKLQ